MVLLSTSPPTGFFDIIAYVFQNIYNSIRDIFSLISSASVFLTALPDYLPTVLLASFSFTMVVYTIRLFMR